MTLQTKEKKQKKYEGFIKLMNPQLNKEGG